MTLKLTKRNWILIILSISGIRFGLYLYCPIQLVLVSAKVDSS